MYDDMTVWTALSLFKRGRNWSSCLASRSLEESQREERRGVKKEGLLTLPFVSKRTRKKEDESRREGHSPSGLAPSRMRG